MLKKKSKRKISVTPAQAGVWRFDRRMPAFAGMTILVLILFFAAPAKAMDYEEYPSVKLRSLDKITARTMTFEAKVGSTVRFGEIFIKVQACRKPPPIEKSEAAAFLQIWQANEVKETSKWIFSGWMFASSPALSAMDHPVYDVWVLDCLGRDPEPIPKTDDKTGVQAPPTDGEVPNAIPPTVEPDKQKPVSSEEMGDVTPEDDPGAFDDQPHTTSPTDSSAVTDPAEPQSAVPQPAAPSVSPSYRPASNTLDEYKDETPADDSSPSDDTTAPTQAPENPISPQPGQKPKQEIEGIY